MRASSRRSHHSRDAADSVNEPRRTTPSDSRASSAVVDACSETPIDSASEVAVVGPRIARRPRSSSTRAASDVHARAARDGGASTMGSSRVSGCTASHSGSRSAATQIVGPQLASRHAWHGDATRARRGNVRSTSSSSRNPQVSNASWHSSTSRGSGRTSSRTRSIAAASSAPTIAGVAGPSRLHGLRSSLLERGVVHEGVWPRVEDVVAERGRLGRVARDAGHLAAMDPLEHALQLRQIHGFFEAVANRLVDERVIGNLAIAWNVLQAGGGIREDRGHEIVGLHALQLRRHLASAAVARHGERDRRVPAPPGLKDRRIEKRLHQDVAHASRGAGSGTRRRAGTSAAVRATAAAASSVAAACSSKLN